MSDYPTVAGRYQLRGEIGDGGMGAVYRSLDLQTQRPVAVKQLKAEIIQSEPGIIERFRREGQALRRLNHPNIVRVLNMLEDEGNHYIVMEYVSGGSLADLIRRVRQIPVEQVLRIALELSDALARAHHLNIIHRDIKPANVLLAGDGTPRLTDFGIAFIGDRSRLTKAQTVMGTLNYMSPEALNGSKLDTRTDIWAFGILIYEMLAGEPPFDEDTVGATISAIFHKQLPDLTLIRNDIPPALISLLSGMLVRDMNQRIDSARLVGAEIQAMLQGHSSVTAGLSQLMTDAMDISVYELTMDIMQLVQHWRNEASAAQSLAHRADSHDYARIYSNEGRAQALLEAAEQLQAIFDPSRDGATQQVAYGYAEVSRREVERLFRKAKVGFTSLYEDQGYIFTAIFPSLLTDSVESRIDALRQFASDMIVLDTGRLEDSTGYIDFAFKTPLRF